MLDLARVQSSTSVKELRYSLFDKITVNIRALRALGISSEQFGLMLSPVIMKTLPEDMKLEISRRLGGRWKIDEILSVVGFRRPLSVLERYEAAQERLSVFQMSRIETFRQMVVDDCFHG